MSDPRTLLPPSAAALSRSIETVMAERTQNIEAPIGTLWHVDTCPVELLPWLAWAFSVEVWEHDWPAEIKRNVTRRSIEVHRLKGTRKAVELALEALGLQTDISEWFEHGGVPHTFRIDAYGDNVFEAGFALNSDFYSLISRQIKFVKPVRSHFTLRIGERFATRPALRHAIRQRRRSVISHATLIRPQRAESHAQVCHGLRQRCVSRTTHDVLRSA